MTRARLSEAIAAVQAMRTPALKAEWMRVFREPAPALSPDLLARGIAYRLQEKALGALPPTARRDLERLVRQLEKTGEVAAEREVVLKAGTRLARDWHGRTHHVLVLEQGFLFEDRHYSSLTAIAQTITGATWSGPRFFGLKRRTKAFSTITKVAADG